MKVQLYGGFMDGQEYEINRYLSEILIPIPITLSIEPSMNDVLYPKMDVAVYKEFARGKYKLVDSDY